MALDNNLFTLNLEPSKIEPGAIDLVDPSGTVHYRKQSLPNEAGTYLILLSGTNQENFAAALSMFKLYIYARATLRINIGYCGCARCHNQGKGYRVAQPICTR